MEFTTFFLTSSYILLFITVFLLRNNFILQNDRFNFFVVWVLSISFFH